MNLIPAGKMLTKVPTYKLCFFEILSDDISWNTLCVDLIGPYKIRNKGKNALLIKSVTTINPMILWFEITEYNDKR